MLDPTLIDSDTPTKPVAVNPLQDDSGDYTYADIDKEEQAEQIEQDNSEFDDNDTGGSDIEQAREDTKKRKKSSDPLDNPMAGAEWGGLDNNDSM